MKKEEKILDFKKYRKKYVDPIEEMRMTIKNSIKNLLNEVDDEERRKYIDEHYGLEKYMRNKIREILTKAFYECRLREDGENFDEENLQATINKATDSIMDELMHEEMKKNFHIIS